MALRQSSFTSCFFKITHILQVNFVEFSLYIKQEAITALWIKAWESVLFETRLLAWQCHAGVQCKRVTNGTENYICSCRMVPMISMRLLYTECIPQCESIGIFTPKSAAVYITYPKNSLLIWWFRSYFSSLILWISFKQQFKTVLVTNCIVIKEGEENQMKTLSLLNLSLCPYDKKPSSINSKQNKIKHKVTYGYSRKRSFYKVILQHIYCRLVPSNLQGYSTTHNILT